MFIVRMHRLALVACVSIATLVVQPHAWAFTQTTGAGSAVATVDGLANFESLSALVDNPYVEGGMAFSRTGLTFNNNGCGFAGAGCAPHPGFAGFSGNFMYGVGAGYFEMAATGSNVFYGLEFTVGTGFTTGSQNVTWQAFSGSFLVDSGTLSLSPGTIVGFSDTSGFNTLRYTNFDPALGFFAPAFDSVRAQFTAPAGPVAPIPEPEIYAMLGVGLGLVGWIGRRKKLKEGAAV